MAFAIILGAALLVPGILWRTLLRSRLARFALPLTAFCVGIAAILLRQWLMGETAVVLSLAGADGGTQGTTYHIGKSWLFLWNLGLLYLGLALAIALTQELGGKPFARFLPPTAGLFHLGSATLVAQSIASPLAMPRRYAEYSAYNELLNQMTSLAALVAFTGLAALALLTLAALLWRGTKQFHRNQP